MKGSLGSLGSFLLRSWREQRSIKQQEMANRIGCDFVVLSKYERGAGRPGLERALRIAKVTEGAVPCEAWFLPAPPKQEADDAAGDAEDGDGGSKSAAAGA